MVVLMVSVIDMRAQSVISHTHHHHALLQSVIGMLIDVMIIAIAIPVATILRWRGYGLVERRVDKEPPE